MPNKDKKTKTKKETTPSLDQLLEAERLSPFYGSEDSSNFCSDDYMDYGCRHIERAPFMDEY